MRTIKTIKKLARKSRISYKLGTYFDLPNTNSIMKYFNLIIFLFATSMVFAQSDCSVMKKGKFRDVHDNDPSAYMEIDGKWFTDYAKNGTEYIKSEIRWLTDCKYELTFVETNIENLGLPKGTKLRVEILGVNGNEITYKYISGEEMKPRKLVKITENSDSSASERTDRSDY